VTSFFLGQNTEVFARQPFPEEEEFNRSFSLVYSKGRTLDIVFESRDSFNTWIDGLSAICPIEPCFGKTLALENLPEVQLLNDLEYKFCSVHHVAPAQFLRLKQRFVKERRRGKNMTDLDFRHSHLISDPYRARKIGQFFASHT
jgi:hypothetical protein